MLAVGSKTGEQAGSGGCVRCVQDHDGEEERPDGGDRGRNRGRRASALPLRQSGKCGCRGQLHEGAERQKRPRYGGKGARVASARMIRGPRQAGVAWPCPHTGRRPHGPGQRKQSQGLEVRAPRHLDDQDGRPQVQHEHRGLVPARGPRHPAEQPSGREVAREPESFHEDEARTRRGHQEEGELREGWVDRRDGGVVDVGVVFGAERCEGGVRRRVQEGVRARELDVAVPEVPVEVVAELRRERDEHDAHRRCEEPDDPEGGSCCGTGATRGSDQGSGAGVRCESASEQEDPGPRKAVRRRNPPEHGEQSQLRCAERGEDPKPQRATSA
ncbi:MAG: hypothetical protein AMS19_01840 [Gemmatimonas sp. SG8_23]|nr:MAG: hypothetical protein AMS19_01840 [Gemmatimonas sp. SG8_23]